MENKNCIISSVREAQSPEADHLQRLQRCRLVLGGLDQDGTKTGSGMFDPEVISLAHGDGTRRPPHEAIAAGVSALLDPHSCALDDYLFLQSYEPLELKVSRLFRAGGIPAEASDNICVECGTTRLFGAFLHCVASPGDVFLAAPTFYHSLPDWCDRFDVSLECVQTPAESGYKLTAEALEAWFSDYVDAGLSPKPKGIFLFNPTQTGAIYQPEELAALASFVARADLMVLADHVFSGTEFPGVETAAFLAAQPGMAKRVVTVDGVSKSHNLANIRIGWACGPKSMIDAMRKYSVSTIISVPRLNMTMASAALSAPDTYLEANAQECSRRAGLIAEAITRWNEAVCETQDCQWKPECTFRLVHQPEAGHSLLVSCAPLLGLQYEQGQIRDSVDVTRFFLNEAGVAVSPGLSSGLDGCQIRICFGSVGLSNTYAHSTEREWQAAAQALRRSAQKFDQAVDFRKYPGAGSSTTDAHIEDFFEIGRETIREALMDRMLPAIIRLMQANPRQPEPDIVAQQQDGVI